MEELVSTAKRDSDRAYERLKELIMTMKLPPGAPLNEVEMMRELGVGRTPLREATNRLALDRLVTVIPKRGTFVAEISISNLQNIFEIRFVLEGFCARLAAVRASDLVIAELESLISSPPPDEMGIAAQVETDRRFHSLLARATQNPILEEMMERVYNLSLRLLYLVRSPMEQVKDKIDEYREVIEALKLRDPDRAEGAIQSHVTNFREKVRGSF